jgi:hypothetical protein
VHLGGGHLGDAGQQLGAGVFVHVGVADEQGALVQHDGVQRGQVGRAGLGADDVADVVQVRVVAAHHAAQHGVGVAQVHHQRADHGVGAPHGGLGRLHADAVARHQAVVGLPVLAKARVVLGVDVVHVHAQADAQAGLLDALLDHGRAADQDGARQPSSTTTCTARSTRSSSPSA